MSVEDRLPVSVPGLAVMLHCTCRAKNFAKPPVFSEILPRVPGKASTVPLVIKSVPPVRLRPRPALSVGVPGIRARTRIPGINYPAGRAGPLKAYPQPTGRMTPTSATLTPTLVRRQRIIPSASPLFRRTGEAPALARQCRSCGRTARMKARARESHARFPGGAKETVCGRRGGLLPGVRDREVPELEVNVRERRGAHGKGEPLTWRRGKPQGAAMERRKIRSGFSEAAEMDFRSVSGGMLERNVRDA